MIKVTTTGTFTNLKDRKRKDITVAFPRQQTLFGSSGGICVSASPATAKTCSYSTSPSSSLSSRSLSLPSSPTDSFNRGLFSITFRMSIAKMRKDVTSMFSGGLSNHHSSRQSIDPHRNDDIVLKGYLRKRKVSIFYALWFAVFNSLYPKLPFVFIIQLTYSESYSYKQILCCTKSRKLYVSIPDFTVINHALILSAYCELIDMVITSHTYI